MREVAVLGAGAAGLVASRHLAQAGLRPVIYDAASRIGGAWAGTFNIWPSMITNLSKHSCRFSDHPWPEGSPIFPSQSEIHNYLQSYADRYLDEDSFRLNCPVLKVEPLSSKADDLGYRVVWQSPEGIQQQQEFGTVVVATGFFSRPVLPQGVEEIQNLDGGGVMHASAFQDPTHFQGKRVAVVGSSLSAIEIASEICLHTEQTYCVIPRVPYVIPRFLPPRYDALDLIHYQRRNDGPQEREGVVMDANACRKRHEYLKSLAGRIQGETLGFPDETTYEQPPWIAISDQFLPCVKQGSIDVITGRRLASVNGNGDAVLDDETVLPVDTVVCATGYETNLDFLDESILQRLGYKHDNNFCPMELVADIYNPGLSGLYFAGMYRGLFFGVVELQARMIAQLAQGESLSTNFVQRAMADAKTRYTMPNPKPQFPHWDYIGHMDQLAAELDLLPTKEYLSTGSLVVPAMYQRDSAIIQQSMQEVKMDLAGNYRNIPSVVLRAIVGKWNFERSISHFGGQGQRTDKVHGTIMYSLHADQSVRYREDGLFRLPNGSEIPVFREYDYVAVGSAIEIFFRENDKRTYVFLNLAFSESATHDGRWTASNDHLCVKDLYTGNFDVKLDGAMATELTISYRVRGPEKDYLSVTTLLRE